MAGDGQPVGMSYIYDRPGFLLRRCHQISVSIFRESCEELDLTPAQFGVLYAVEQNPGVEQIGVATMLGLDRSTTADVVDRLISRDLARREGHATDRRRCSLTLTTKGGDVLARARAIAAEAQERLLEPLAPADRDQLLALLHKLMAGHGDGSRVPFRPRVAATQQGRTRTGKTDER
ncbi:MAG TPA: MarR family winged helix-turn-helix transcriptional regulator [Alphaproteobacteria bacterium]|jgi:DNA-binding MarR family transcriptional regulator|nr:MarR family winged helix-turn-helix transcriptional regulator [Alphaproteobacteria bacterium]